jgi:hypothetical protein
MKHKKIQLPTPKEAPTPAVVAARRTQWLMEHQTKTNTKLASNNAPVVCVVHTEPDLGQMNIDGTIMNFTKGAQITLKRKYASRLHRFVTIK